MATPRIKIKIDTTKATRKLKKAETTASKEATPALKAVVKDAFNFARDIMPKDTKQTYKAMDYVVQPRNYGASGEILVHPVPRGEMNYSGKVLTAQDMVRIMSNWGGAKSHFKSGAPDFMKRTRDFLRDRSKTKIKNYYKQIKFD